MNAQQSTLSERVIISEFNVRPDNSINIRKSTQILKDSVVVSETYWRTVLMPNDNKLFEVLNGYDDYINLAIEAWKDIPDSLGNYNTNELTDSAQYIGNWRFNIKGQITNGKVKINANEKYIFNPNLNQPRTVNIPLNVKTNLIKINIDGINYLLIKNDNGKYISTDKSVRFTKLE
ncbi:hypothetical protein EB118_23840 [bacterium]|nr:hypothetical protein [bacterium]